MFPRGGRERDFSSSGSRGINSWGTRERPNAVLNLSSPPFFFLFPRLVLRVARILCKHGAPELRRGLLEQKRDVLLLLLLLGRRLRHPALGGKSKRRSGEKSHEGLEAGESSPLRRRAAVDEQKEAGFPASTLKKPRSALRCDPVTPARKAGLHPAQRRRAGARRGRSGRGIFPGGPINGHLAPCRGRPLARPLCRHPPNRDEAEAAPRRTFRPRSLAAVGPRLVGRKRGRGCCASHQSS